MTHQGDIGLELYVATDKFPDFQQHIDSQIILGIIKGNGIRERLDITHLDDLTREFDGFDNIKEFLRLIQQDPTTELRLPYLVHFIGCETSHYFGYSGLKEIRENLNSI